MICSVRLARKGDMQAFEWLYRQFSKAMYNICIRMTVNIPEAEDALQEAFVKAFKNLHTLKEEKMFGGWLRQITVNECLQRFRKARVSVAFEDNPDLTDIAETEDACWMEHIDMSQLQKAIGDLPNGCKQIFTLYAVENYTHRRIAEELGISEGTSKSQYMRAKRLLRENLTKKFING